MKSLLCDATFISSVASPVKSCANCRIFSYPSSRMMA